MRVWKYLPRIPAKNQEFWTKFWPNFCPEFAKKKKKNSIVAWIAYISRIVKYKGGFHRSTLKCCKMKKKIFFKYSGGNSGQNSGLAQLILKRWHILAHIIFFSLRKCDLRTLKIFVTLRSNPSCQTLFTQVSKFFQTSCLKIY